GATLKNELFVVPDGMVFARIEYAVACAETEDEVRGLRANLGVRGVGRDGEGHGLDRPVRVADVLRVEIGELEAGTRLREDVGDAEIGGDAARRQIAALAVA